LKADEPHLAKVSCKRKITALDKPKFIGGSMENSYAMPHTKKERETFWKRVIEEQKVSGIPMEKFCQKHQIPFYSFRNQKYRLTLKEKQRAFAKSEGNGSDAIEGNGFVQVQIAEAKPSELPPQDIQYAQIKIIFSNPHIIELSLPATADILSAIITQVAK
jgi:hypothetical protein